MFCFINLDNSKDAIDQLTKTDEIVYTDTQMTEYIRVYEKTYWKTLSLALQVIAKSGEKIKAEVSVAFENSPIGVKLPIWQDELVQSGLTINPSDYFAFDEFQSKFSIRIRIWNSIAVGLTENSQTNVPIIKGVAPTDFDASKKQWLYFHPQLDYNITATDGSFLKLAVCDAVGNCFAYHQQSRTEFVLPYRIKKQLAKSPYIKIISNQPNTKPNAYTIKCKDV